MKNVIKHAILIFTLIIVRNQTLSAQWTEVSAGLGPDRGLIEMTAPNLKTCYATVYDRTSSTYPIQITSTHNGGKTWHSQRLDSLFHNFPVDIVATKADVVHVVGWDFAHGGGNIFRSFNGGATWKREGANAYADPLSFPDDIAFFNSNDGVIFGDPLNGAFEIYTTSDGGDNWNQVASDKIPVPLENEYGTLYAMDTYGKTVWTITFILDPYGYPIGGRLLRSGDKGKSWNAINSNMILTSGDISIRFRDLLNGMYKNNGVLYRTSDGGTTWNVVNYTGTFFNFDFDNVPGVPGCWISTGGEPNFPINSMYGIGSSVSYDDGNSWSILDTGVNHTCIEMVSNSRGFTGGISTGNGTDGAFYYSGSPFKMSQNNSSTACSEFDVNVYPNPSNESFTMALNSSEDKEALLRIYNMQGILITTQKFNPSEILYFGNDFVPGLYIAEVFIGNERQTIRLVKQ